MKGKCRNLGEGMRWLMVAALPSGVRAGGDAVDWLLDDPVFTPVARRLTRPVRVGLGMAIAARP